MFPPHNWRPRLSFQSRGRRVPSSNLVNLSKNAKPDSCAESGFVQKLSVYECERCKAGFRVIMPLPSIAASPAGIHMASPAISRRISFRFARNLSFILPFRQAIGRRHPKKRRFSHRRTPASAQISLFPHMSPPGRTRRFPSTCRRYISPEA